MSNLLPGAYCTPPQPTSNLGFRRWQKGSCAGGSLTGTHSQAPVKDFITCIHWLLTSTRPRSAVVPRRPQSLNVLQAANMHRFVAPCCMTLQEQRDGRSMFSYWRGMQSDWGLDLTSDMLQSASCSSRNRHLPSPSSALSATRRTTL